MFPKWYTDAKRLHDEGLPYYKIGELLQVNRKTVSYYLRKGGSKSDSRYVRKVDPNKFRKYQLNEDVFSTIDNEENAYWLGFLCADGNVSNSTNCIEIGLQEKDLDHLKKLQRFFQTNKPNLQKSKNI